MKTKNYQIRWRYSKLVLGRMICSVEKLDDENVTVAIAECSAKDHFNKDTGRKLSLLRALQNANVPKKERKEIWEAYRTMTKKPRWGK